MVTETTRKTTMGMKEILMRLSLLSIHLDVRFNSWSANYFLTILYRPYDQGTS